MDSELLGFQNVGYAYPDSGRLALRIPALRRLAIDGLTFSVPSGAAVALLGANGSGKSTLLQIADGLIVPDAGCVNWQGREMDRSRRGLAELRSQVGMVFQNPDDQLFGGTLFEDVALGPLNQGLPREKVRQRVEEALETMRLRKFAGLPPHVLSHGLRKRAALAGVLALRPRLLLLDEPTAGLDPMGEVELLAILSKLVEAGTTVLLSTHDLELAGHWAREGLVLAEGRLLAHAPIDQILSDDALLETAGLRGRFPLRSNQGETP